MPEVWEDDTIAAISTPLGTGGIAGIRISGPESLEVAERVLRLRRGGLVREMPTWSIALGDVVASDGSIVDEAVVLVMRAPMSYTGEDTVEIQCHGGRLVSQKVLAEVFRCGARPAMPGEFTRRAYLSGRICLDEAEAVYDVITATSEAALKHANKRLRGELSALVTSWEDRLLDALATIYGSSDFPEDVLDDTAEVEMLLETLHEELLEFLARAPLGLALASGIEVCLVGRPNVGKSSLFNAFLSGDRAIVTDVPGTTRDVLRETTEWAGVPVVLLDTAGLRETTEVVEAIGVARAESAAVSSEVILYVVDDTQGLSDEDRLWLAKWSDRRVVLVVNKIDEGKGRVSAETARSLAGDSWVRVSSLTGEGLQELKDKVLKWFPSREASEAVIPGSARQVECIRRAATCLETALRELAIGWPQDVVAPSLEEAARSLAELTGTDAVEVTLDRVFEKFCVGK
ncbi:MAG: tRNA uridine-5-carboxymethylaminomethyl(34) synthesis GTPase MnmE [Bacillota bacterium]